MSLLEDVFLEDEAGEAQELERVIEGDEFDERPRSRSDSDENSAKEDEAEEDKRRVDPTSAKPKRVIKNPRFVLNPARLTGPRGIQVVTEHFKDFKFKGKGHEREDLDLVLKKLEHWAYRLYPKFQFEDCLKKIETLGKKRAVAVHLHRIRTDQIISEDTVVQKDSSDDEAPPAQEPEEDEFDKLLQQQIDIARSTPAPSSVKKTPLAERSSMMPKATSSPSINEEQRERMLKNRRLAEERRLARLAQSSQANIDKAKSPIHIIDDDSRPKDSFDETNKSSTENHGTNNATIELDDEGIVVKNSKTHELRIDDSKNVDETETVDIPGTNNGNIVELDDDGLVVTKSSKTYIPAKKHNKSKIVSSDDEDSPDDGKHKEKTSKNTGKPNILDSSDSDDEITSKTMKVDVENHVKKHNRSHVIDSSDSEDEAVVMNESITVDVHGGNQDKLFDSLQTNNEDDITNSKLINNKTPLDSVIDTETAENCLVNTKKTNIEDTTNDLEAEENKARNSVGDNDVEMDID